MQKLAQDAEASARDKLESKDAGEKAGIYLAELDVDQLRSFRDWEVWGVKNRRPELYGRICEIEQVST